MPWPNPANGGRRPAAGWTPSAADVFAWRWRALPRPNPQPASADRRCGLIKAGAARTAAVMKDSLEFLRQWGAPLDC